MLSTELRTAAFLSLGKRNLNWCYIVPPMHKYMIMYRVYQRNLSFKFFARKALVVKVAKYRGDFFNAIACKSRCSRV